MSHLRYLPLLALLALSGCSNLLHSDAPALQLYVLQAPAAAAPAGAATAPQASLRIARPLPGPALNTDRIALLRPGSRLDYFSGSRWSAPLADVVSDLELALFHADGAWSAIADDRSSFNADYLLQTSIDQFAADYATDAGPPVVRVAMHCLLIRRSDGALVGSFQVKESEPAGENRMASVVTAFSAAADRALLSIAAQADALLRSAKSPGSP